MRLKFWKKESENKAVKKKSLIREWGDAAMFAVVAATLIRWATFEAYAIPTSSMEKSLLVGDYLFVSKLHYGPRTPGTPLQVPLTHQTILGTGLASYSDAIQIPSFRFPGFSEVKHNDPVVFNFPAETNHPTDLKTYYIKRCVGIAGDSLTIRNGQVFINGKAADNPEERQFEYFVSTDRLLNEDFFRKRDISEAYGVQGGYMIYASPEKAQKVAALDFIREVKENKLKSGEVEPNIFPQTPGVYKWNRDNYGPLYIPKSGATVAITPETLPLYERIILAYEQNKDAEVREGQLFIDRKEVKEYTFKQNYYFMMGDNRHNSLDSRYWGFVPEDHLVGKAMFTWMSVDPEAGLLEKIRWNRLFSKIE